MQGWQNDAHQDRAKCVDLYQNFPLKKVEMKTLLWNKFEVSVVIPDDWTQN